VTGYRVIISSESSEVWYKEGTNLLLEVQRISRKEADRVNSDVYQVCRHLNPKLHSPWG